MTRLKVGGKGGWRPWKRREKEKLAQSDCMQAWLAEHSEVINIRVIDPARVCEDNLVSIFLENGIGSEKVKS